MRWFVLFFIGVSLTLVARAEGVVQLVLSEAGGAYEEAANAFIASYGQRAHIQTATVLSFSPEQIRAITRGDNLVVPIGLKATRYVAENHGGRGAVLGMMVPRVSVAGIRWPEGLGAGQVAFVYIDQPLERSLDLLEALLPKKSKVGVVFSSDNAEIVKSLEKECGRRGLSLISEAVDTPSGVGPALRQVLAGSDIFLLLPDAVVLNGANLQSLLLASYRMRVPVIGFSPGLVKSGAVAAVFSTPGQIGAQGGSMARRWGATGSLPNSQYASQYSLDINSYVARSLDLPLPSEKEVAKQLGARE